MDEPPIEAHSLLPDTDLVNKDVQELTLFWENFLNSHNEHVRVEWLELFMYKYEDLIKEPGFNVNNKHLLSSIPSHFICYLLKLVYTLISECSTGTKTLNEQILNDLSIKNRKDSYLATTSMGSVEKEEKIFCEIFGNVNATTSFDEADGDSTSDDVKAIVALRDFLAKGTGGRMLRVLENLDLKSLLCSRELASVLVSFFPRSNWSIDNATESTDHVIQDDISDILKLKNAIQELEFHTRFYFIRTEKSSTIDANLKDAKKSTLLQAFLETNSNVSESTIKEPISQKPQTYHTNEFHAYQQQIQTCDYVGSTILNILQKLIVNENHNSLVKSSATVKSLWFAVSQYGSIEQNQPFQNVNHAKIKRKLLTIIYLCFNKIFPSGKKLDELFDVKELMNRLLHAIEIDWALGVSIIQSQVKQTVSTERDPESIKTINDVNINNLNTLIYCLFLITQNVLINRSNESNLFEMVFDVFQQHFKVVINGLLILIKYDRNCKNEYMEKILHILLKLIYLLHNIEVQQQKPNSDKPKPKKKLSALGPSIPTTHHQSYKLFKCTLESIVLHIAQEVKAEKLRVIIVFFQKYTICCCNIHLDIVERILENSLDKNMHKIGLNFIKQNVLRTIFNNDIRCANCDTTRFLYKFKEEFISMYKSWFHRLSDSVEIIIFFKHIAKISKYLHVDVQSHILVDIVLPLFRKEKSSIMDKLDSATTHGLLLNHFDAALVTDDDDEQQSHDSIAGIENHSGNNFSISEKTIICCLHIFLCYLKDVTVIKAFFIHENIQHIEDLFVMPQFAYLVSNVLKIGVDSGHFLGETSEERQSLSERLEQLQINLFSNIIDILINLYNDVSMVRNFKLKQTIKHNEDEQGSVSGQSNRILKKFHANQLSTFEIVHLSVVYWNSILQIIRSSHDNFRIKVEQTLTNFDNVVFNLVYNSLSCVLFMVDPKHQQELERQKQELKLKQFEMKQQTLGALNSLIISTITLGDFEVLTTDELNVDFSSTIENYDFDNISFIRDEQMSNVNSVQLFNLSDKNAGSLMNSINNGRNGVLQSSSSSWEQFDHFNNYDSEQNDTKADTTIFNANNEMSFIYSVKNVQNDNQMSISAVIESLKNGNSVKPNYNHIHLIMNSVQKLKEFVSRKVFGAIIDQNETSASSETTLNSNESNTNVNRKPQINLFSEDQLTVLSSTECKKLLMQLFEITLGVLICDYKEKRADIEMSNALQELKSLLLSKSVHSFDTMEQGTLIVNALQSLLKVAEMRNKCCFFDDCAHPTLARQNKFSLNISLENDRLLLLTGQCTQNSTVAGDYYGQSDGDTTETDNSYETADEGYDADAEAAKFADTDFDSDWSQSTTVSAPMFRTHVVHEGICKIVIEILIDLSKRCLINPNLCLNSLMQIATRLFSIRDLLGGSLYLVKGFASVLESNDMRLRDFQKSILDLITDLNTPDTLSAYLNLMTSESPPLDILLSRLIYLGSHGQSNQPSIEIEFPVFSDEEIKYNCDQMTFENIKKICNSHEQHKIKSPFSQAAYIAPLGDLSFKPWSKDGFTVTSWLRLNSDLGTATDCQKDINARSHDVDEEVTNQSSGICTQQCLCKNKQHFISIGTSAMVLSIYLCVTNVNTMYFQLTNPNVQFHKGISKSHSEHFRCSETTVVANGSKKSKCTCSSSKKRRGSKKDSTLHHETRHSRKTKIKENHSKESSEEQSSTSNVLSATINTTRLALKSSLSHFSLFSANRHNDKEADTDLIGFPVEMKGIKLYKNRWTLFSVSSTYTGTDVQVQIYIDNSPVTTIDLPCPHVQIDAKREKFSILCIGHRHSTSTSTTPTKIKDIGSPEITLDPPVHSEIDAPSFKYSLSNVLLFRKRAIDKEILANLYALGPDCVNFAQCQIGNIIPNLGIPGTSKLQTTISTNEVLCTLREHILTVYSAHQPNTLIGYNNIDEGESSEIIKLGIEAQPKYIPSFHTALFLSGGLSSMLYMFARVVELSNSDIVQSSALQFFLKTAHSSSVLYTEFVGQNYITLLGPIIRSDKCLKTIRLLNSVLETACSGSVISKGPDGFELSITKNICIIYADLFVGIINHYSDWHSASVENCDIIEMLFSVIQSLVSEKHSYQALNIARLNKAKLVPALFNFCKIHLTGGTQQKYWSQQAADSMVNIIRIFAGAPPGPSLLDDIIKVLLMLHPPSNSFVTHDRSKFYFLLSSSAQQKSKRNGLPLSGRKLSLSLRKSPSSSMNSFLHRSTSLDQSINKKPVDTFQCLTKLNQNSSEETVIEMLPMLNKTDKNKPNMNGKFVNGLSAEGSSTGIAVEKKTSVILNANDKAKFERALSQLNTKRQVSGNKRLRKLRVKNKGRQRSITECEIERDKKSKRKRKRSVSDSGIDLALFREYDIIADEEVKKISSALGFSDKEEKYETVLNPSFELSNGIIHLQNGLLELLRDFILILPDTAIEEVLSHYVTLDIVLVLANNLNASVRASIIRLLGVMCDRHTNITKAISFFHLGNQISLYAADFSLVQSCVQWVTGSFQNIEQIIQANHFKITQKFGLSPLIAIIPQTIHDISLAKMLFQFMNQLYSSSEQDHCAYMIENGLLPAIVKSLARVYIKWGSENDKLIEKVETLLCTIALKALSTAGCINILWDLLNGVTYIEQNRSGATYRGIRSTQATILLFLIKSFFSKQNNPSLWNFKLVICDINLNECVLSASEKRTRLELLLDRSVQFVRTANLAHTQTSQEIKLIETIVILSMSGFSRGSSIIPWSFLPDNPMPLKLFVTKLIWKHAKSGDLPSVGCDPKLVKAMIHSFWLTDREIIPKPDSDVLMNVCKALRIQQNANSSHIPQAIVKMDLARENSLKEQKPSVDRTVYKFDSIAMNCIESAMKITRYVVEIQNSERRNAIAYIRVHDESCLSHEWNLIVDRMTHEGAPWHTARMYSNSWELDPTEGPTRIRIRMRRCNLEIPKKFFLEEGLENDCHDDDFKPPLSYLNLAFNERPGCTLGDQVLYTFLCKHLQVDTESDGELIITESNLIFIANDLTKPTININVNMISDVWMRRYQHADNALEFFLETNTSIFLIFQSTDDREMIKVYFADKILQCPDAKLNIITQQWREGQITNWDYLIALNLISGRTYQDLMQYPVFPWILSDYESTTLDLNGTENFRNLAKPIAIQHASNEDHYINSYNYLNSLYTSTDFHQLAPYHYGSHYSNSGTVLHFLVRVPPFTRYFLHYQDNNFDLPDRTFHSILTTWRLASRDSTTDVKELIPEFFTFPEFLENSERFNFGIRQSGEPVDNVHLPPWSRESSRLFVLIHRQALESDIVRRNLHRWIDLVFGCRQIGQAAVESLNVFHPATYYGFSSSDILDPVERSAMETMVRTYGQMPRMLFKSAHPASQPMHTSTEDYIPVLKHIKGLHWGCYTGSPALADPRVCCLYQQFDVDISHLMALPNTNVVYAFSAGHDVMQGSESDTMNIIQWKQTDGIVRIKPLRDSEFYDQKPLTYNHHIDEITICGTDPNFNQLWFGHVSGRITVYQCNNFNSQSKYNKNFHLSSFNKLSHNSALRKLSMKFSNFNGENDIENGNGTDTLKWKDPVILVRHTNTVTGIHISKEFKIVVTVANDGYAVIWDANNLKYIRSIQRPSICKSPISLVTISPTLGDIVTIHDLLRDGHGHYEDDRFSECYEATENIDDFVNVSVDMNGKSLLRLHTINGKYISHITIPEKILSVCYSYVKEGTGVNVIATGLENGIIRLWSSWDLSLVREFMVSTYDVLSVTYSTHQHLVVLTSDNIIQVWDSPGLHGNPPKFPQVVFQKRNSV